MIDLYEHNKESYEKIIEMFKTENRVTVVQPTGTGKSFLMLKLIEDYQDENIIILTASNAIANQLYNYAAEMNCLDILKNVEVYTYTKFLYMSNKEIKSLSADKIIIDEFHRTGAITWNKKVNILLKYHKDSKVLGLTATPVRYLDNARNMTEELFYGNIANEITLGEAVYRGILPMFKYISASYTHDDTKYILESIKRIQNREERLKRLKEYKNMISNIEKANKIENLFKENIDKSGKFIVFCKSIAHTKECKRLLEKWFNNISMSTKIYISTSDDYDKDEQLEEFIKDTSNCIRLLLSVNRFNEGLHVKDISGVIMMRPTKSPIMYLQQLGRALYFKENYTPIIFDIVNNYSYIIPYMNKCLSETSGNPFYDEYMEAVNKEYKGKNINFNIFTQAIEYNNLIKKLEEKLYYDTNQIWNSKFELIKEFKNEFGRFPYHEEIYKDIKIGSWLSIQRYLYSVKRLPEDRKQLLESIGLEFISINDRWNSNFELVKEFKNEFGRFPQLREKYKNAKIGGWLQRQRLVYIDGKLPEDRKQLLESIGLEFISAKDKLDQIWNFHFELLKEFKNEFGRFPKYPEIYKDINIVRWLDCQKQAYNKGKLPEDRKQLLESIGFEFISAKDKFDQIWNSHFELLKEFKNEFGRLPIQKEKYKGVKLGKWKYTQIYLFKNGKLPEDRKQLLESIGFEFINRYDNQWNLTFELVKEFKNKFGRFPRPGEMYKDINIGQWLNTSQKRAYNNGKLSEDRKQLLESIGFEFVNALDNQWNSNFELLKEFKNEFDRFPRLGEMYKDINIGQWLSNQKVLYNKGKLPEDRKQLLESIGFKFISNIFNNQWNSHFELLKEFKNEFGRLPKGRENYKSIKIGSWAQRQKVLYNKGKLPEERKQLLESIGFEFSNKFYKVWNSNFELLKEFKNEFGKFPKSGGESYKDINLGSWLSNQKQIYNNGKLPEERKQLLESIGVEFKD